MITTMTSKQQEQQPESAPASSFFLVMQMMMISFLYHSIFLLYFFYLYHSVSSSSLCLSSVYHVCLRDKTLISTLYLHTISLAPWSFIHDGVVVSGRWHDFSLSLSLLILTSHPSSLTIATCIFFAPFPVSLSLLFLVSPFPSQPREMLQFNKLFIISLSHLNVPVLLPSLLSFSIFSLSLSLDSRFDSTRRPLHAIEMNSRLSLRTLHCFVHFLPSLCLCEEKESLTRKLLSFNLTQQTLTNTFSYEMKYRHTQTPLLYYILYFFLLWFLLSRKFFLSKSSLSLSLPFSVCYYISLLDLPLCV